MTFNSSDGPGQRKRRHDIPVRLPISPKGKANMNPVFGSNPILTLHQVPNQVITCTFVLFSNITFRIQIDYGNRHYTPIQFK